MALIAEKVSEPAKDAALAKPTTSSGDSDSAESSTPFDAAVIAALMELPTSPPTSPAAKARVWTLPSSASYCGMLMVTASALVFGVVAAIVVVPLVIALIVVVVVVLCCCRRRAKQTAKVAAGYPEQQQATATY